MQAPSVTPAFSGLPLKRNPITAPTCLLQNERCAAALIGCPPQALRQARHTGMLWGVRAPAFVKIGRNVRYRTDTIMAWIEQFAEQHNTLGG